MTIKSLRKIIVIFLLGLFPLAGFGNNKKDKSDKKRPNILLVVADDMGYRDLNSYGGIPQTPNTDQLARNGIRFTDFYAPASNCSPSRAGLLTGRSPARVGMYSYRPSNHPMHLRDSEITIAEVLKVRGYQTAHFGKWHLGNIPVEEGLDHPQPDEQGFDYWFATENNASPSHLNPNNFIKNGEELGELKGYACQLAADELTSWLDSRKDTTSPFFINLSFNEPHRKVASPPELVDKYDDEYTEFDAKYHANIENIDSAMGRIMTHLKNNDLMDNTLIIFSSDNGSYRNDSNGGLEGKKSFVYDGGIRVPGIIHWPETIKEGRVSHEPVGLIDMMPTILDLVNADTLNQRTIDGTSILPIINGNENQFERDKPLFWFFYRTSPEISMRIGDYMIMGRSNDTIPRTHHFTKPDMDFVKNMELVDYELYNLAKDQGQYNNIFGSHPDSEKFKKMLNNKLDEIQKQGYTWDNLPEAGNYRKVKTEWMQY